jgi:hypothetical protein
MNFSMFFSVNLQESCEIWNSQSYDYEDYLLSGVWSCLVWYMFTDVSDEHIPSIYRAEE